MALSRSSGAIGSRRFRCTSIGHVDQGRLSDRNRHALIRRLVHLRQPVGVEQSQDAPAALDVIASRANESVAPGSLPRSPPPPSRAIPLRSAWHRESRSPSPAARSGRAGKRCSRVSVVSDSGTVKASAASASSSARRKSALLDPRVRRPVDIRVPIRQEPRPRKPFDQDAPPADMAARAQHGLVPAQASSISPRSSCREPSSSASLPSVLRS